MVVHCSDVLGLVVGETEAFEESRLVDRVYSSECLLQRCVMVRCVDVEDVDIDTKQLFAVGRLPMNCVLCAADSESTLQLRVNCESLASASLA